MRETIAGILLLLGTVFILLSAIGIFRMPDLYTRMSATTKASTLGIGLVLAGTVLFWFDIAIAARAISIIVFLFLTAPVAAHIISRAAYFDGVPLWKHTKIDELARDLEKKKKQEEG